MRAVRRVDMGPRLLDFSGLHLGPFPVPGISTRGTFLALGLLLALALAARDATGPTARRALVLDLALPGGLVVLLAYRLLLWLRESLGAPSFLPPEAPFLAAACAGLALVPLWASRQGMAAGAAGDILAAPLALLLASWHLGAFLAGWGYGAPTALPWGIRLPETVSAAVEAGDGVPRHPVQLYLALLAAALCLLLRLYLRLPQEGRATLLLGSLYGYGYFLLSFFRADGSARYLGGSLSLPQMAGVLVGFLASCAYVAAGPPGRTA